MGEAAVVEPAAEREEGVVVVIEQRQFGRPEIEEQLGEAAEDPQTRVRELIVRVAGANGAPWPLLRSPLRFAATPTRIGQRWMESGQIVGISLYSLHFNAENWRDPHTFDPGRFLDARPSPFRYAPFGGGHRRCIGAALATTELSVAIGTIMTTLDLRAPTVAGRRTPRSTARGIAVTPLREIRLEVVGRRG